MSATSRWRSASERHDVAVDHVSFAIKRGECVALVGESGSGKSVSALSILKLLPYPTASHPSGSIRFKGRELLHAARSARCASIRGNDISIIFQEPMTSLNPLHTIEAQIGEILLLHSGISGADGAGAHARTADAGRHSRSRNAARRAIRINCPAASASAS